MNTLKLSDNDHQLLSGASPSMPIKTALGQVILLAGNECTETLIKATERELSTLEDAKYHVTTLNFFDNPDKYDIKQMADILKTLLADDGRDACNVVLSVFHEVIGGFYALEPMDGDIGLLAIDSNTPIALTEHSVEIASVLNALLRTYDMKDGIIIIKDFNIRCWSTYARSQDKFITAMLALAKISNNRLILETDNLDTVKSFTRVARGTDKDITCTLVTLQGNHAGNCSMLKEAEREFADAVLYANALQLTDQMPYY